MLVVKAVPGSAHAIAAALDRTGWSEVAGSLAGDDTVFVACVDRAGVDRIRRRLLRLASLT
jgi:transcriptional regulator of arginine metabolism